MTLSILLLTFQFKPVQTWAAKKAAAYLADELHTKVGISSLYLRPFSSVVIEGLYIIDKQKDTILNTPKLAVDIKDFYLFSSIKKRTINFENIELDNGSFYLKKQKDSTTNLKFIIDYFNSGDTTKNPVSKPWTLNFDRIAISNFHFRYKNHLRDTVMAGVNFNDLDVQHFSTVIQGMDIKNHLFKGDIQSLSLHEKSGFTVKHFSSNATIDTNQIKLQRLAIQTPRSDLKDFFWMKFKSFDDFDDFENKVHMDANFKSSRISSSDIAYFTSALEKVSFDLGIDGQAKGIVNNLNAKHVTITGGQATFLKGDFKLHNLTDWDNAFLELKFDQVASNKKDLDYLIGRFSGNATNKAPSIVSKFGNFNFSGRFTGSQNDFVAYGVFKTALGRFDSDINLKIDKNDRPSYSGRINAYAFDLGTLIDESDLDRATFTANIKGSGDEIKNLVEDVDAKIANVTYNKYTYNNLTVKGTFIKQLADARITVNDRNIKLDLKGKVNLKLALPTYDLTANIKEANLNKLGFSKDTLSISTQLKTQFRGNDLHDLEGEILFSPARIVNSTHNYVVDSLYLSAVGQGTNRAITLRSDFADGGIKGKYDLATLPSYFKTIVKKYIPSINTTIVPPKPEKFDFNLTLKNLDPLLAVFAPDIKVPDQGNLVGQFDSDEKTATLSGYIKTLKYGKTVFHDIILDESTSDDMLGLNLALKKIDLTDSLFIKDINISNFLKHDSLNFNIKLSDKNAVNQLDLYGLVEFGRDTTAKLALLPSDVILEKEKWKIEDKVRIRLLDGKTQVSGFELSNGSQKVFIDGFISDNPADELKLSFEKFNMRTFNQLTKTSGIFLNGYLNGDIKATSVLKSPGVDSHLTIDSLTMNKTLVGNVKLTSTLGNDRKQADINMNIINRGLETMNIGGSYYFARDSVDNNLDFNVKMNQTEAIIFEPFVKDLVSNLKGHISTDLKLTGKLSNPQLNGNLTLVNTGLTVNYLKTAYTINNRLDVNNSTITLKDVVLHDIKKGTGTANGTVNLNNLSNPDIDVTLKAENLMALNTTFKDNHLYYGTAYGTGTFSFKGPVDNMKIDITASTNAGTIFNIPLNTSSTASDYDFITFVSHSDTAKVAPKTKAFNGVTLNFDLSADEQTVVRIATDYGRLEGSGVARNLKLNINSLGDFEMYGDYLISSGKFEFTAKNFISKNFTVSQGGTIRWTGNPSNAEINLRALYEVRTTKAPLYAAAGLQAPSAGQQTLVQAELILTKSLLQPTIDFDFNFPTDPSVKDDLATYLADANNRSQQAISIIVRRNFTANSNDLTNQVIGTAGEAASEFAFNKLNNLIAQSNIRNFDLNIRSFSDASVAARFYDNRLSFSGSLYSNNGSNDLFNNNNNNLFNQKFNTLTRDFEVLYKIRRDGNLTARYSYRALNNVTLSSLTDASLTQYVNGFGLVYQRDFDTFGEFIRNLFRQSKRKTTPVTPNPTPNGNTSSPAVKPDEDEDQ